MATRKRKQQPATGDLVAIPLSDGTVGLGLLVYATATGFMCIAMSNRARAAADLKGVELGLPVAATNTTDELIEDGDWPIVDNRPIPDYLQSLPYPDEVVSRGGGLLQSILDYYHRIDDDYAEAAVASWRSEIVFPWIDLPRGKALEELGVARSAPTPSSTESCPLGPAKVHVRILYEGRGLPAVEDLRRRQRIQARIEELGGGEVTDAGAGDGVLDIHFETQSGLYGTNVARFALQEEGVLDVSEVRARSILQ
jgi:hypothetical protein